MAKEPKQEVDYRKGSRKEHCGICTMFVPMNSCTAVEGPIFPAMLCNLFKRKKSPLHDHPRS